MNSKYLKLLPAVLREDGPGTNPEFLGRFLLAFERVLSGLEADPAAPYATDRILDRIQDYFDPDLAPPQFLHWLAGWVALELREEEDWMQADFGQTEAEVEQAFPLDPSAPRITRNRGMIKSAASLYRKRGTRAGLEEFIAVYAGAAHVRMREFHEPMQIGVTSIIGDESIVGERPYYFQVIVSIPAPTPEVLENYKRALRTILDREKPAHTYYDIIVDIPTMQVGVASTVGGDTLMGGTVIT